MQNGLHKAIKNMKEKLLAGKYWWFEKFFNFVSACRSTIRCKTNICMQLYIFDQILKIRWILIAIVLAWIINRQIDDLSRYELQRWDCPSFQLIPRQIAVRRVQQLFRRNMQSVKNERKSVLSVRPRALFLNCTVECKRSLSAKKFKFRKKMFSQDYQVGYFLYVVTVSPKLFKSFPNWISSLELHRRNTLLWNWLRYLTYSNYIKLRIYSVSF